MSGTLFVVATPIGNLEDITVRALRILREAHLIAAEDTRRTAKLLRHYQIETPTTSFHEHNERQKLPTLLSRLRAGQSLALVSDAGTPAVSDPGFRLIRAAIDHAVRVEPIPGASAVLTALIASGLPTDEFTFLGFPPARSKDKIQWFHSLAAEPRTLVFFESPHRIRDTLGVLRETIGDRQICVGRELTKAHEEFVRGPISEVVDLLDHPRGEYTIVIDRSNDKIYPVAEPPADEVIRNEFCHMTDNGGVGRRAALSRVASRYGLSTRAVYAAIERAKRSADIKL